MNRSINWTITINNPTELDYSQLKSLNYSYLIYADEVGNEGTPHIQAYVHLKCQITTSALSKLLPRAHLIMSGGNHAQNRTYIVGPYEKDGKVKPFNDTFVELGTLPKPGKRNDLHTFDNDIKNGKRGRDLSVDHLEVRAKYPRLEQTLIMEDDENRAIEKFKLGKTPEVHIRWGEPGTGKSRYVFDNYEAADIYEVNMGDGCNKSLWWDGYRGHKVILINDFDGSEIGWKYLLRLLDRYPFRMQIKGGHVWKLADYIYITSNDPPEMWYPAHSNHYQALARRFTSVNEIAPPLGGLRALTPLTGAE